MCPTLCDPKDHTYSPWNSPGQNTRVGSLCLLQGIVPTQGSNPGLLHCRRILYQLSHKGRGSELRFNLPKSYLDPTFSPSSSKWRPLLEEMQLVKKPGVTVWACCPLLARGGPCCSLWKDQGSDSFLLGTAQSQPRALSSQLPPRTP